MNTVLKSVKDVFTSGNAVIYNAIHYTKDNRVRIDARTKHHVPDKNNNLSEWVSYTYANKLCLNYWGRSLSDLTNYKSR